ncbi:MAG TPA: CPBP family intramembrane glutamic endopeptidase [Thermosynechococcaceae cyanobacterium]
MQREHFGYSFQVRSRDIFYTIGAIVFAFLVLVPVALILKFGYSVGTVTPKTFLDQVTFFLSYIVLFSFRVGIFEEVLFRSGLMTLIRDQLQQFSHDRLSGRALVLASALICSVIFGLCHVGNDPAPGSALSPLTYKFIYAGLATIASMFYALAFGETNRLAGAIVIHGVVDTTAVVVLGAALTVPF